jgi:hypothetical protein
MDNFHFLIALPSAVVAATTYAILYEIHAQSLNENVLTFTFCSPTRTLCYSRTAQSLSESVRERSKIRMCRDTRLVIRFCTSHLFHSYSFLVSIRTGQKLIVKRSSIKKNCCITLITEQ